MRKRREVNLATFADGRDENNLAEFPIALLSDSAPSGQKTIEFEDKVRDWSTGKEVVRRVSITGSDKFGLPTAKDEDVLLALLQLTKLANGFSSPDVWFTKHQVIAILGWKNRGWAYNRVEESLHRWKGVTIHYWNAWRDKARDAWCDSAAIGVIDYFALTDGRRSTSDIAENSGRSRFAWNKVFFESFQAGYLKKLDFAMYRQLQRPAARRAFRFLDKRFWHQPNWMFDLREFACEKLGFSRAYNIGQLKERLRPALDELEEIGFIQPVTFHKQRPKVWQVAIAKKCKPDELVEMATHQSKGFVSQLVQRGVEPSSARELAGKYAAERITEKMALVDWLNCRRDKRVARNPAGFLVAAIRNDYPLPKDYLKQTQVHASSPRENSRKVEGRSGKRGAAESTLAGQVVDEVSRYLKSLSPEALATIECEAVKRASVMEAESYQRLRLRGGKLFAELRVDLLRKYVVAHSLHLGSVAVDAA